MWRSDFTTSFVNLLETFRSKFSLTKTADTSDLSATHDALTQAVNAVNALSQYSDATGRSDTLDSAAATVRTVSHLTDVDPSGNERTVMVQSASHFVASSPMLHTVDAISPRTARPSTVITDAPGQGPTVSAAPPLPTLVESGDAASDTNTAYVLQVGQTGQGNIAVNGDRDWFAVDLQAGQQYAFALVGTGVNNLIDPILRLMDTTGTVELTSDDDSLPNNNSIFAFTPGASGRYYLNAASFDEAGPGIHTGQYGITVTSGARPSFDIPMGAGVIDGDVSWSANGTPVTVTYAFRASPASYTVSGSNIATFTQLSAGEIAAVRATLQAWSEVSGISFVEVNPGGYSDNATILFGNYTDPDDGAGAFAFGPGSTLSTSRAGDVWLNTDAIPTSGSILPGSYAYNAIMHEIGHTLGLSHPGLYNAGPNVTITYANNAQFTEDSNQYSTMSYFDEANTGSQLFGYPESPMLFDTYAAQQIYGINLTTRAGNSIYGFNSNLGGIYDYATNPIPAHTIWDAGGSDTIDASGYGTNQLINLNEGTFSNLGSGTANVSIAIGAVIEKAIGGSADDTLRGNAADNRLEGRDGIDTLIGGAGNDTLIGGTGGDTIDGGAGTDDMAAYDMSFAAVNIDLQAGTAGGGDAIGDILTNVESVSGSNTDDQLFGDANANRLIGNAGNDLLDGRTGVDQMLGGFGDDTYYVDSQADLVNENADQGSDTVIASTSLYLSQNVENLTLSEAAGGAFGVGNDLINVIQGNGSGNLLIAHGGDDTVNGGGGSDQLFGLDGADALNGDAGIDYLVGGIGDDTLRGGADPDALYGEDGNDYLDGGTSFDTDILVGGAGNDTLYGISGQANPDYDLLDGASGDDVYWVDTGADLTFEAVGDGIDTIRADVTVANAGVYLYANVENLVLEGTTAFGVGNELNNQLTGSASGNWLLGGFGSDTINGLGGNDVLFGEGGADTFVFGANSGADVIGDFTHGTDQMQLTGIYNSFAQLQAAFVQNGADGAIDLGGGNLVVLLGVSMSTLTASDFFF